ncbi:SAV_2336 N-terminal domain-related protein [Streptomyces sp. NPDC012769]|uniref:SAV_2336 N-terminal domain-related protein n=1 Tax=Streptomyces sp. NPDC012769 TaxID=3364848 RepID=UPI00368CAF93
MTSDALSAFAALLGRAGEEPPTGRELAELLWLARQTAGPDDPARETAASASAPEASGPRDGAPRLPRLPAGPDLAPPPVPAGRSPSPVPVPPRVPLRTPDPAPPRPAPEPAVGHAPLLAPAPPMLARPLALQRSLRPLRRTVPSAAGRELDEAATADRIAAVGAWDALGAGGDANGVLAGAHGARRQRWWLPVLRPRQERWLHLRIVVDCGPTMPMWRPLVRELHTAFTQTGAFRTLDVLRLGADGRLPPRHRERGRTAVLVVSDAMGPQWRDGSAGLRWRATLAALGDAMPVALLQPLPERLWRHSAAPAEPGRFVSPAAGVPNTALRFFPYDGSPAPTGVVLPVVEPDPVWLGHWAALVASPAGTEVPGAAAFVTPGAPAPLVDALVPEDAEPEELVLRFRALASPQAFRLAAHLAVGSAHLPVMRLVQAAVEERPAPRHLAEVVLSGMLRALPGTTPGAYEFRPGVREVLLGTLPRTSLVATADLLARVSAEIEDRAGVLPGGFAALVETLGGQGGERAVGRPFALLSEESVRLLRGPEALPPAGRTPPGDISGTGAGPAARAGERDWSLPLAQRYVPLGRRPGQFGEELLLAHDETLDRRVLVRVHPYPAPEEMVARVQVQQRVTHPHLLRIHSALTSLEGRCAVVCAALPGTTLRDFLHGRPAGLDMDRAVAWAGMLCSALVALHGVGLVHGRVRADRVMLSEREEPVLTDAAPGRGRQRAEDDLHDLGLLLYEMCTGRLPPDDGTGPVPLRELRPDVPLPLETTVLGLLSDHHAHRRDAVRRMAATYATGEAPRPTAVLPRPNYRVLGPVKAWFDTLPEADALILARLLLARGDWVAIDDLHAAFPVSVTDDDLLDRLSRLVDDGHPIDGAEGSARIVLGPERFDLVHAERLVSRAEAAVRTGDRETSARLLQAALLLWREEPLANLPGAWAEAERARLVNLRARWEVELVRVLKATVGGGDDHLGSRVLAVVHAEDGAREAEFLTDSLLTRRTPTGGLLTSLPPQEVVRRAVKEARVRWSVARSRRPVTGRLVVGGPQTDEGVLAKVASALPEEGRRLLIACPRWVGRELPAALQETAHPVPGHAAWQWLEVPRGVEDGRLPDEQAPAPSWHPALGRRGGFLSRLFRPARGRAAEGKGDGTTGPREGP